MTQYKRIYVPGGTYFFTLVTHRRRPIFSHKENISLLGDAMRQVRASRAVTMEAIVVLPDHLHCVWTLPEGEADFSGRWREIKKMVTKNISTRVGNKTRVWQNRFWEHLIRDESDWRRHLDYICYNPVKHGLVHRPADWHWSSFNKLVKRGWYEKEWGSSPPESINNMELE